MSRIHEALRIAKIERAMPETVATPSAPDTQKLSGPAVLEETAASLSDVLSKSGSAAATLDYLQFDQLRRSCTHHKWNPRPNVNIFADGSSGKGCAEQFRTLRSRLSQLRNSKFLRTLLVTSAVPGEGKTFVVTNLAQAIVRQPDSRALIIDADLRGSTLHEFIGAPATPGLADYLRGDATEAAIIQFGALGPKSNLCLIPAGTRVSQPSELLANGRLKTLLSRVGTAFDWVIIDSPPCLPVADASILADVSDGVLVVVKAGSTSSELVRKAHQELRQRNVIGIVLNAVREPRLNYGPSLSSNKEATPADT